MYIRTYIYILSLRTSGNSKITTRHFRNFHSHMQIWRQTIKTGTVRNSARKIFKSDSTNRYISWVHSTGYLLVECLFKAHFALDIHILFLRVAFKWSSSVQILFSTEVNISTNWSWQNRMKMRHWYGHIMQWAIEYEYLTQLQTCSPCAKMRSDFSLDAARKYAKDRYTDTHTHMRTKSCAKGEA